MKEKLSEPLVLKSNAGYYIGRLFYLDGSWQPYDRLSYCYYSTEESAYHDLIRGCY